MTSRYCLPDHFLMLEASPTSASNLEWFLTQFFEAEREAAKQQGNSIYDLVNELVGGTTAEGANIVFLPFLFGSNADPDAKASLVGLGSWHTRAHVLRAIYEGVVFGHKAHVDRLMQSRQLTGPIRLTGGAARSEVWVQIFADVFQTPVEIPSGTELGALGAAICASVAAGCHADYYQAVEAMVKLSRVQQPNTSNAKVYAEKYERYQEVLTALDPVWKDLS
jgi:L-xylulokinase